MWCKVKTIKIVFYLFLSWCVGSDWKPNAEVFISLLLVDMFLNNNPMSVDKEES